MADFGWAFVKGGLLTGSAPPSGSVQFNNGANGLGGSTDLIFESGSTSELRLTGSMNIEGDLSASVNISASAFYGDGSNLTGLTTSPAGSDNQIQFNDSGDFGASGNLTFDGTSLSVTGDITASVNISASAFFGDGSSLTGISSVNIANDGTNRVLTADGDGTMTAESNFTFDGSTLNVTGTLNVSGTINANQLNIDVENRTVINISKTGSTNFGDTADDRHRFTGSMNVSGDITGSGINLSGLASGTAVNDSSYLAIDSSNNIILTSSAGGAGGTIGAAEDGDYTDGLFTDFAPSTPVGTPIDRFNEVLKILAPSPAPSLSRVNYDNGDGSTVKLSFGAGEPVSGYSSSDTTAGFDAVDVAETYQTETSGSNFRLGVYDGTEDVTGFLNFNVAESQTNGYVAYSADAFANAETGSLKLELNGTVIKTVNLASTTGTGNPGSGTANDLNEDGSGFTNISITASSFDGNNSEWYIFKHRTAKIVIDSSSMRPGWNYARAIHTIGSTDYATNYLEWISDPSGSTNDLSVSNGRIEDVTLVGSKYLSGVQYNTDATAKYKVDINNLYRNVYAASGTPISFTVSNSTTPSSQAVEDIDDAAGEDNTKVLGVTASLDYNGNSLLSGSMTANVTVTHPFKNTISNTGSATTGDGFLIDNRTLSSTTLIERFHDETYRKISGSYDNQIDVTTGSSTWNSQNHMTSSGASGHEDGLLFYNQRLYSPIDGDIVKGGNFAGLSNVESGQPDYSGETGVRTFYRAIQNPRGYDVYNARINSTKNSTIYDGDPLSTGNINFYVKVPGATGWMDISNYFSYGNTADGNGALINGAANDTDSGNNTHYITFGTQSVPASGWLMMKIVASASWAGYIDQLTFTLPANQSQGTPSALSDIDANSAGSTAILSFGTANSIAGYSDATGSSISLTDFNSNDPYVYGGSESNRRGVFDEIDVVDGTLNDAIGSGTGYPADAFFNGFTGSLVLEVNGVEVHSSSLDTLNAISNDFNANSSGFDLSAVSFSTLSNIPAYTKPYRTGTYQIGANDQNNGWNYARVIHRTSSDQTTNYIEWVNDPSGSIDDTSVSTPVFENFNHTSFYHQSGIGYFAANPTSSYAYTASNFYKNVYQSGSAISFPTTTNCNITNIRIVGTGINTFDDSVSSTSMPALNNDPNCEQTSIEITGTVQYSGPATSISGALSGFTAYNVVVNSQVIHPFKSTGTTSALTKTAVMRYVGSIGSTNLNTNEYFNTETYRIVSGAYANQAAVTSSANSWNPSASMNDTSSYVEHSDGMVISNGYLFSPLKIGNAGDTRSTADGGSLQAPSGNPNYSTSELSESVRTVYRYFRNETGASSVTPTITFYGDANLIAKGGSFYTGTLGSNKNMTVELKVPYDPAFSGLDDTSTAWADVVRPYSNGVQPTTDGVGIYIGGGSDLNQTVPGTGRDVQVQLQESQIRDDQYFILKISAHKDWTGYLSRIEISY